MKQLFELVLIGTKSDLPKQNGEYLASHKENKERYEPTIFSINIPEYWLECIHSYLRPVLTSPEPKQPIKAKEDVFDEYHTLKMGIHMLEFEAEKIKI